MAHTLREDTLKSLQQIVDRTLRDDAHQMSEFRSAILGSSLDAVIASNNFDEAIKNVMAFIGLDIETEPTPAPRRSLRARSTTENDKETGTVTLEMKNEKENTANKENEDADGMTIGRVTRSARTAKAAAVAKIAKPTKSRGRTTRAQATAKSSRTHAGARGGKNRRHPLREQNLNVPRTEESEQDDDNSENSDDDYNQEDERRQLDRKSVDCARNDHDEISVPSGSSPEEKHSEEDPGDNLEMHTSSSNIGSSSKNLSRTLRSHQQKAQEADEEEQKPHSPPVKRVLRNHTKANTKSSAFASEDTNSKPYPTKKKLRRKVSVSDNEGDDENSPHTPEKHVATPRKSSAGSSSTSTPNEPGSDKRPEIDTSVSSSPVRKERTQQACGTSLLEHSEASDCEQWNTDKGLKDRKTTSADDTDAQEDNASPVQPSSKVKDPSSQSSANNTTENAETEEKPQRTRPRFNVDANGKITAQALGAFANFMSASNTTAKDAPTGEELSSNPSSFRQNRLFKTKEDIYVSSKKPPGYNVGLRPPVSAASMGSLSIARTPGMRKPSEATKSMDSSYHTTVPAGDEIASSLFPNSILRTPKSNYSSFVSSSNPAVAKTADASTQDASRSRYSVRYHDSVMEDRSSNALPAKRKSDTDDVSVQSPKRARRLRSTFQGKSALRTKIESLRKKREESTSAVPPSETFSTNSDGHSPKLSVAFVDNQNSNQTRLQSNSERMIINVPTSRSAGSPLRSQEHFEETSHRMTSSTVDDEERSQPIITQIRPTSTLSSSSTGKITSPSPDVCEIRQSKEREIGIAQKSDLSNPSLSQSAVPPASKDVMKSNIAQKEPQTHVDEEERQPQSVQTSAIAQESETVNAENVAAAAGSTLSNLMTSVKSFLPSTASFFGYGGQVENSRQDTEEQRAARLREEQRADAERREAEMFARRELARIQKQAEAEEKHKRAEANRKMIAEADRQREEEKRRKEKERMKKLQDEIEARKKKKADDEMKREARRKKVLEHQRRVAEAEEAKRLEMEKKNAIERMRKNLAGNKWGPRELVYKSARTGDNRGAVAGPASKAGPSGHIPGPSSASATRTRDQQGVHQAPPKTPKTPGDTKTVFDRKSHDEHTSYQMTAERPGDEVPSSDDDDNSNRKNKKKIPDWARNANVLRALQNQTDDPDLHFERVHSVNLEEVFASTQLNKKRYRTRTSSAQWARDRLTAQEEMEYKRQTGYFCQE